MSPILSRKGRTVRYASAAFALFCLTAGTACAHHPPAAGLAAARSGGKSTITSDELRTVDDRDAYSAISILRPSFLENRGRTSILLPTPDQPEVYIDGMYYGPFETLRQLPVHELAEIRLLDVGDATIRYGMGHPSGIIDITSLH